MIVVVGCGHLGSYLIKKAAASVNEPIIATVRDMKNAFPIVGVEWIKCDVCVQSDLDALTKKYGNEPKTVFYFAAAHKIDEVYQHPQEAKKVNLYALTAFLETVPNINNLFFSSTDCVYGENNENTPVFDEQSVPEPLNEYGKQKLSAEQIVLSHGYHVVRLPLLFGASLQPERFTFYDVLCEKLLAGQSVEMIDGLRRSLLSFQNAADILFRLSRFEKDCLPSVLNVCSDDSYTKYEIGCMLAEKLGVSKELVCKIPETESRRFFKDRRASCTVMDNTLLKQILGLKSIQWESELC